LPQLRLRLLGAAGGLRYRYRYTYKYHGPEYRYYPTSGYGGWWWGGRRKQSVILFFDCRYISSLEPGDEPIPSVKTLSLLCELGAVGK
jgi:hypothetical protein